jgi:hypothetical protein
VVAPGSTFDPAIGATWQGSDAVVHDMAGEGHAHLCFWLSKDDGLTWELVLTPILASDWCEPTLDVLSEAETEDEDPPVDDPSGEELAAEEPAEEDENNMVARVRTGYINHDTGTNKKCDALFITIKRGETVSSLSSSLSVSWSNTPGKWTRPMILKLGAQSDRTPTLVLRGLGVYRQRAWEFAFVGEENMVISSIAEQYEVLEV